MERNGRIRILGWIPNDDVQFVHLSGVRTLSNDLLLPTIIIYMYSTVHLDQVNIYALDNSNLVAHSLMHLSSAIQ